jgi:peptidoglycan/LPS O-acetylase OafA/YrhL
MVCAMKIGRFIWNWAWGQAASQGRNGDSRPSVLATVPKISHANNFDLLRLLAATGVIVSHATSVTGVGRSDFGTAFLRSICSHSLGSTCVIAFFVMSGLLLTESIFRSSKVGFSAARVLRIYPALMVAALFFVFVAGPILTNLPLLPYFKDHRTWDYLQSHLSAFQTSRVFQLPGVFADRSFSSVSGALWTLFFELRCYFVITLLLWTGFFSRRWIAIGISLGILIGIVLFPKYITNIFPGADEYNIRYLYCAFWIGALITLVRGRKFINHFSAIFVIVAGIAAYLWPHTLAADLLVFFSIIVAVLWIADCIPVLSLKRWGDVSYGIFIYGMFSQQLIQSLHTGFGIVLDTSLAILVAFGFASASWFLIEKPGLDLKRFFKRRLDTPVSIPEAKIDSLDPIPL